MEQHWVRVKDRLPPEYEFVLAFWPDAPEDTKFLVVYLSEEYDLEYEDGTVERIRDWCQGAYNFTCDADPEFWCELIPPEIDNV